jgi:hypothetical protein
MHNGQDKKSTDISSSRWMDEENMTYIIQYIQYILLYNTYNGILLSHKKAWNLVIWDNMDGTGGHHIEWNKPGT